MTRGRRRQKTKQYPPGIIASDLPKGAYWDESRRHWYTVYRDPETGRQRRKRIAGPKARMSEIHRALEALREGLPTPENRDCLRWLAAQFERSPQFKRLARATQQDYEKHAKIILDRPSKQRGLLLGDGPLEAWKPHTVQRLVDLLTEERGPSTANHALRYLRRLFTWGLQRGHVKAAHNPAKGVEAAVERKQRRCPTPEVYGKVLAFAKAYSGYPYLWCAMELTYLLRARGIEALDLTDANETPDGILLRRRKGSRDAMIEWGPRLRAAWNGATKHRRDVWEARRHPTPMKPEDRPLFVARDGHKLRRSSLSTAWQRMITAAIEKEIIAAEDRFSMHDLKRAGVTRTQGTRADKQEASGHRSSGMLDVYDQSVPKVRPTEE